MKLLATLVGLLAVAAASLLLMRPAAGDGTPIDFVSAEFPPTSERLVQTDDIWRDVLEAEEFRVLRTDGTERAFTGEYWDNHADGLYVCSGCGTRFSAQSTSLRPAPLAELLSTDRRRPGR